MKTTILQPERLTKLANHLIRNQNKFKNCYCTYIPSFAYDNTPTDHTNPFYIYPMVETAKIFKDQLWYINRKGFPLWVLDEKLTTFSSIISFYGLSSSTFCHLFIPSMQTPQIYGGKILTAKATPVDLAVNMLELIKVCDLRLN